MTPREPNFGWFDDARNEYVVTTPLTPRPWENRIWNEDLNIQVTNHGTGIIYERDHRGGFILYNWSGNRALYVLDRATDVLWSPAWYPVNTELDAYEARHGLMHTALSGRKDGVQAVWRTTVHPAEACELWQVELRNDTDGPRALRVVAFYQVDLSVRDPYFGSADRFEGTFCAESNCLYLRNASHRRPSPRYALAYHSDRPIASYELASEAFLARYSALAAPAAVRAPAFGNSSPDRKAPVFAVPYDVVLEPGGTVVLNVQIFAAESAEAAGSRARAYAAGDVFGEAMAAHTRALRPRLETAVVRTADPSFDRYANVWIKHQLHYNAVWNRGWAMGFRDSMQDADAWRLHDTARVRRRLEDASRHMYRDGHTVRKWAAIDDKLYFDGGVWYVNTLVNYVRESGDDALLDAPLPYLDGGDDEPVLAHAKRAMNFLGRQTGPGGICRMGFGDWNDALNGVDREGRGESVWTTMAFIWSLRQLAALLERRGDADAAGYVATADRLRGVLNARYFEDDRYIRAVTDDGTRVGSRTSAGGQVYLNPQAWSINAAVADAARAERVLATVRRELETPWGPALLAPAYAAHDPRIGRITADRPGTVENGGTYVHAALFYAYALALADRPDDALDVLQRVLPSCPGNPPSCSTLEPFSITNAYEGVASRHPGRAMFAWRTGSAGWFLKVLWDGLLGLTPDFDALRIDARLPAAFGPAVRASRRVRGMRIAFVFAGDPGKADVVVVNRSALPYAELRDGMSVGVRMPEGSGRGGL